MQQALRYAGQLDVPLAYSTNGKQIIEHNLRLGTEREVEGFAAPAAAWDEYRLDRNLGEGGAALIAEPFNRNRHSATGDVLTPRFYQLVAINRALAAISRDEQRLLLLMATGTGKTFTAMQIVAKLRAYEASVHPDRNYRVLYLADRDQLLTQPMKNDFIPAFGGDVLKRVLGKADTSRELYFATYQALSGGDVNALLFENFRADFFDLVIVDECHRGSASEDSAWRSVLDYFSSAVQLGLTATPRSDKVNSYEYFGNPIFKYSLRQGIEDGFLAPYRVRRVVLSPDADGWEPTPGQLDRYGSSIPEGVYSTRDFERVVSLLARTTLAAQHLSGILRKDPGARCMVFCVDTEHADDMRRALISANPDLVAANPEWVVRIVGVEGEKQRLLEEFCDPDSASPVVATTSRLLSTGVDVQDLKYVVLFRPVGSMVEFKQIIGRGTRLYPDKGKTNFEIVDYVGATKHFQDPAFDGYPAHITIETVDDGGNVTDSETEEPHGGSDFSADPDDLVDTAVVGLEVNEPEPGFTPGQPNNGQGPEPRLKYFVDDGSFSVVAEGTMVADTTSGRLVLTEYGQFVRDRIAAMGDADEITQRWSKTESRHSLMKFLAEQGVDVRELVTAAGLEESDPLDALLALAWDVPARTRAERVRQVRQEHAQELEQRSERARQILEALLQRYEAHGVEDLESPEVLRLPPLSHMGSLMDLAEQVGGTEQLLRQLDTVQEWLYVA